MKQRYALSPSLEQIEQRLFGVSDGLVEADAAGETSERIAQAVNTSPEWARYHSDDLSTESEDLDIEVRSPDPPPYIRDLIQQRVAASEAKFSPSPMAGQVVEVCKIVLPPKLDQLDWVIQAPLYVLLDRSGETDDLWQGWPVSAETDYASFWDFVLQEQDEPFDPEAGMVQVWNPVRLYLPMAGRVVAELRPERLHAVRAMAADFLRSDDPIDKPWPGRISVRETSTGAKVATGSPIGGQNDPRWQYQKIYRYAADAIRRPANLVLANASIFVEQDWAQKDNGRIDVFAWLRELFAGFALVLAPVPVGATLGSDEATSSETCRLGNLLEVRGTLRGEGARQLKVRLLADTNIVVIVREEEGGIESYPLSPEQREATFDLAAGRHYKLNLQDAEGRPLEIAARS